jgi:hypothetical protein
MGETSCVAYEYGEMRIDPADPLSVPSRLVRRLLLSEGKKAEKRFGHLVHPETGERPTVVLHIPKGSLRLELRLVTDSTGLREWLIGKGVVVAEAPRRGGGVAESAPAAGVSTEGGDA